MKLVVANAPHVRTDDSVRKIMIDVLIALMPAVIGAVIFFGWYSLIMCIIGAFFAEFSENKRTLNPMEVPLSRVYCLLST